MSEDEFEIEVINPPKEVVLTSRIMLGNQDSLAHIANSPFTSITEKGVGATVALGALVILEHTPALLGSYVKKGGHKLAVISPTTLPGLAIICPEGSFVEKKHASLFMELITQKLLKPKENGESQDEQRS